MKRWALIQNEIVATIVEQDTAPTVFGPWVECPDYVGSNWLYDGVNFTPPPPPTPIITKVAMISRFTPEEYVAVVGATSTDIEVQAWYDLFQAASVVNLVDPRTIAGINSLANKGLITQARADEILTAPVQENEKP